MPGLGMSRLQPRWQTPTSQPLPSLQLLQLRLASSLILISAGGCRDTGTDQWISCWLSLRAGVQDLLKVPGGATVCLFVPEVVSHCAAIQCSHFAWQLSTRLGPLATNGIVFIFLISLLTLRIFATEGTKNNKWSTCIVNASYSKNTVQ